MRTWVGSSSATTRQIMLGMGLNSADVSRRTTAKRAATPSKTKVVRTSKKKVARSSGDLPRPPACKRK